MTIIEFFFKIFIFFTYIFFSFLQHLNPGLAIGQIKKMLALYKKDNEAKAAHA